MALTATYLLKWWLNSHLLKVAEFEGGPAVIYMNRVGMPHSKPLHPRAR